MPCRDFVLAARDQAPPVVDDWSGSASAALALAAQYNRCVDVVLDFRWRHMQMVRKYVWSRPGRMMPSVRVGPRPSPIYMNISRTPKQLECPC